VCVSLCVCMFLLSVLLSHHTHTQLRRIHHARGHRHTHTHQHAAAFFVHVQLTSPSTTTTDYYSYSTCFSRQVGMSGHGASPHRSTRGQKVTLQFLPLHAAVSCGARKESSMSRPLVPAPSAMPPNFPSVHYAFCMSFCPPFSPFFIPSQLSFLFIPISLSLNDRDTVHLRVPPPAGHRSPPHSYSLPLLLLKLLSTRDSAPATKAALL
jgi:hypothetical protein